ncbi:MAG TPA: PspA/IM30 family protein [Armatimonadota bacterium]|jgi:hypothetical protein
MRKTAPLILIACALAISAFYALEMDPGLTQSPAVTALLLFAGSVLILSRIAMGDAWRIAGAAGMTCVGLAVASQVLFRNAEWTGTLIFIGGMALLVIEARVIPGRGISAFAGTAGVFAGTYIILVDTFAVAYAILASSLIAMMSFITLLAYISTSPRWREMSRTLKVSVGRSQISNVATSQSVSVAARTSSGSHSVRKNRSKSTAAFGHTGFETDKDVLERMNRKCAELRLSSIPIMASHLKAERSLAAAKSRLEQIETEARKAAVEGRDDLAKTLLMQLEVYEGHIDRLMEQCIPARHEADSVRLEIENLRKEIKAACRKVKDPEIASRLAALIFDADGLAAEAREVADSMDSLADTALIESGAFGTRMLDDRAAELEARNKRADEALSKLKQELRQSTLETETNQQIVGDGHSQD